MNRYFRTALTLLLVATVLTACSWRAFWTTVGIAGAAAGGAAAVYYTQGDLEADFDHDSKAVHEASLSAVKERGYAVQDTSFEAGKGTIKARLTEGGDDKSLKINTKPQDLGQSHISIRVGTFGDEELSRAILRDIEQNLN